MPLPDYAGLMISPINERRTVSHTIGIGTILIEQGTPMPNLLKVDTEPYVLGWSAITNLTRSELGRELEDARWTFFYMAGEIEKIGFGFNDQSRMRRAIARVITTVKLEALNSLEITQIRRKSFLGMRCTKIRAHGRHIQVSPVFHPSSRI